MLLRRITQHLKDQNWLAVGLDLVIVVFGVWLAFQITEWSEQRDRQAVIREQLGALQIELDKNLDLFTGYLDYTDNKLKQLTEIRDFLTGNPESADTEKLTELLGGVWAYAYLEPHLSAYEAIKNSGNLRLLSGQPIGDAIYEWHRDLAVVIRNQESSQEIRDRLLGSLIASDYSLASSLQNVPYLAPYITASNFKNSFEELTADKAFDDALAINVTLRWSNKDNIEDCITSTEELRSQIDEFLRD